MGQWVGKWVELDQITKNRINLEFIEIIQFCLKISDFLKYPNLRLGVWVVGWMGGSMAGARSNTKY